jgi:biotin transport system substrate-specific component
MQSIQRSQLAYSVYAALFTGLITAGAFIAFPLPGSPVPIVLQNFFVLLAGLLLPLRWALASVGLYLALGAVGLPVFSAARGGLAQLVGPTGGYLVGFLPAVAVCSLLAGGRGGGTAGGTTPRDAAAVVAATAVIYLAGAPWLAHVADMDAAATFAAGVLPFLPGDLLKIAGAVAVARVARPLIARVEHGGDGGEGAG